MFLTFNLPKLLNFYPMNPKKIYCSLLMATLLICRLFNTNAQDDPSKPLMIYPSVSIGFGFFYPEHVNEYIEDKILSGYTSEINTELYMYYEIRGGITLRMKTIDFGASLEYDIAPKFVVVTGSDNITYAYGRFAPEIFTDFYIPSKSGKNAFFIGAGINYSFMKFKEYSASAPGASVRAGYSIQLKSVNFQPYALFRYVKASDPSGYENGGTLVHPDFELSYTAAQLGVNISFHRRMLYK